MEKSGIVGRRIRLERGQTGFWPWARDVDLGTGGFSKSPSVVGAPLGGEACGGPTGGSIRPVHAFHAVGWAPFPFRERHPSVADVVQTGRGGFLWAGIGMAPKKVPDDQPAAVQNHAKTMRGVRPLAPFVRLLPIRVCGTL